MPKNVSVNMHPAKILLFGEYAVLFGGNGLAIPYNKCQITWAFGNVNSELALDELYKYVFNLRPFWLDLERMKSDLDHKIFLKSNIPWGKGLGSSGAVVAAILHRYGITMGKKEKLPILVKRLQAIENYYHGNSSGFDPLVSYLNQAVLKDETQFIPLSTVDVPVHFQFFLLDSGLSRDSKKNIVQVQRQLQITEYQNSMDRYISLNNQAIQCLIQNQTKGFMEIFEELSRLQYHLFSDLIPNNIKKVWKAGHSSRKYWIKLCGSGGGGFFWGIAKNELNLSDEMALPVIHFDIGSKPDPDTFRYT